ncbi:hypothetical protein K505DRAFT_338625 [Melanomma pulvis-pyrius CBS 109.77]|uniref:Uncharacterized protein n=1 Tax=Melanomma pulvis-pyrius CBS 109.77 TaxID=1314802 RepID=A0A6A6X895_9PLEO|nr:hypothetical protein K505DRAFT_338625 [Melanomma pulvis-pyrius CBS 109.77]
MYASQLHNASSSTAVPGAPAASRKRKADNADENYDIASPNKAPGSKRKKKNVESPKPSALAKDADDSAGKGTATAKLRKNAAIQNSLSAQLDENLAVNRIVTATSPFVADVLTLPGMTGTTRPVPTKAQSQALYQFLRKATMISPVPPPTPTSTYEIKCPINWDLPGLQSVDLRDIEIYELREPWNPTQLPWNELKVTMLKRYPRGPASEEAYRKRFWTANRAVFLVTGRYYENSLTGLGAEKKKWNVLVPKAASPTNNAQGPQDQKKSKGPVIKYEGSSFQFRIREGSSRNRITRDVPLDLAKEISPIVKELVEQHQIHHMEIEASVDIADKWISFFVTEPRDRLPTKLQVMVRERDEHWIFEDLATFSWTMNDLFAADELASKMRASGVRDLIISNWRVLMHEEKQLVDSYRSGVRDFHDLPAQPVIRMLDFEPHHMNELWARAAVNDPARKFWLDLLKSKGIVGAQKIVAEWDEFCTDFQLDCVDFLETGFNVEIERHDAAAADTEESHLAVGPLRPVQSKLAQSTTPDKLSAQDASFHDPAMVWTENQQQFCLLYHNHSPKETCKNPLQLLVGMGNDSDEQLPVSRPSHHVKVVFRGVQYMIQNHTQLPKREFCDLPAVYPEWDWHKIRAVNDYQAVPEQHKLKRWRRRMDPSPVYFMQVGKGNYPSQDPDNRFPNHPGYRLGELWNPSADDQNGDSIMSDIEE